MQRNKVVFVIGALGRGGAQTAFKEITTSPIWNNWEKHIICPQIGSLEIGSSNFFVHRISGLHSKYRLDVFIIIYFILKKIQPKIVYTHLYNADFFSNVISRVLRIPNIWSHVHGRYFFYSKKFGIKRIHYFFLRPFHSIPYIFVNKVFTSCNSDAQWINYRQAFSIPLQKINISYNFPSSDFLNNNLQHQRKKIIIWPANFDPIKGHEIIWAQLQNFGALHPDWRIKIYGNGKIPKKILDSKNTSNLEIIHGEKIEKIVFKSASFSILPSLMEGCSLSILESMSCGCPVITFDVGGNAEIIDNSIDGFLVTAYQINSFFSTMETIVTGKINLEKMRTLAKQKIEKKFSKEVWENNFIKNNNEIFTS